MRLLFSLLILLGIGISSISYAQETEVTDSTLYLIKKTDGGEFYGYIVSDDGREILLMTKNIGKIYINKSEITSIEKVENKAIIDSGGMYSDYRNEGPFTTRYYFITNAFPLEKDENYALIHLYGPEAHVGVSDRLSLGVMSTWIASPIGIAGKYSLYSDDNTNVALGTIVGSSGYLMNASGYFGLHWLAATKGSRSSNVTLSLGYGFANLGNDGTFSYNIGQKYYYDNTDQSQYSSYPQYAVLPDYKARQAMDEVLYGADFNYDDRNLYRNSTTGAYVVGLSGITPVGKKASFIFDVMSFVRQAETVKFIDFDQEISWVDPQFNQPMTQTFTIGKGQIVREGITANIVIMPAMRFNNAHNKAFQVALAGVIHIEPDDVFTFPVPMISWLRQF